MVPRNLGGAIQDADVRVGGDQGQRTPHGLRRDGIFVEIEVHVDGFTGLHRHNPIGVERMQRKRQQAGLFFGE